MEFDPKDILTRRFGALVAKKYVGHKFVGVNTKVRAYFYTCDCDCGQQTKVNRTNLLTGHTKSCGCLKNKQGKDNKDFTGWEDISGKYWTSIKTKAKRRSRTLPFTVTIQEAWNLYEKQDRLCALTNLPIYMPRNSKRDTRHTASLDRIDNDLGYISGNIQWVHKDLNWMKGMMTQERFVSMCELVTKKHGTRHEHFI